jgi:predicted membrane protein
VFRSETWERFLLFILLANALFCYLTTRSTWAWFMIMSDFLTYGP